MTRLFMCLFLLKVEVCVSACVKRENERETKNNKTEEKNSVHKCVGETRRRRELLYVVILCSQYSDPQQWLYLPFETTL